MSTRSLTQSEAEHRATLIEVERYDIDVDLTDLPTGPEVRCVSTITFSCREPGSDSFVDCAADVVSATLNGAPLTDAAEGRIALPDLAEHNTLRVESVQANTTKGEGVHKSTDPADGEVYLWMSFEPDEARYVWACFDQPDLKAPHAFTVTAPTEWTVLSNSGDPDVEDLGDARRWSFPDTPRLSTYNLVINAGPLHGIRREAAGFDLGIYARQSLASLLERDADEIFTVTEQGLAFFGDVFQMPFPQRKYDQVFMPDMGGAMENFGCVTWSDVFLRRTPPTAAELELLAKVLLHEMAHMWFGNIVTMRWWDDLWLNEAYAELAAHWAAERATAYTDAWATHLATGKLQAYLADQGPISHPIRQPIHDVAQAASIFDAITYPKGASVLQQLMTYVGEAEFSAGMAAYFAKHAWANTTLQDLIDELASASGRDLDDWRAGWLETAGTDRLALEEADGAFELVASGPDGDPRPQTLAVGAYRQAGNQLERVGLARVEVQGVRTPVDLAAGADLYLVNDDDLTFATARPDASARDAFFATASGLPSAISRGVAVATVWDMLVTGDATASEVVTCLTGVLRAETSDAVVEPYLLIAGDVAELWSSDADRADLMAAVTATCQALAKVDSRRKAALRTIARTASNLDEVAWLQSEGVDDVDLQWRALVRKAELGADTSAEVNALLTRDPDPDAWVRALAVQAAQPDADTKAAVWKSLALDRSVPIGSFNAVASTFWRPGQQDLLAPYAEKYLELLPHFDQGGMIPAMVYTNRLFPVFAISEDFIERSRHAAEDAAPVVRKVLTERSDLVQRMLRSRG